MIVPYIADMTRDFGFHGLNLRSAPFVRLLYDNSGGLQTILTRITTEKNLDGYGNESPTQNMTTVVAIYRHIIVCFDCLGNEMYTSLF